MPFDSIVQEMFPNSNAHAFGDIPEHIAFNVEFEPTKVADKKYVINTGSGDYLGVVGHKFSCASHPDFFERVQNTVRESMSVHDLADARVKWQSGRWGAFAMMDITLPNVKYSITTKKHQVDVAQRIIALHGVDGLCSNQVYFGAIDFFCTNGMIAGDWEKVRRKNTANFSLNSFIHELEKAKVEFHEHGRKLQTWADKELSFSDVEMLLPEIIGSKRSADKMGALYLEEAGTRGHNVYALYSAFTNYASYADERNGFQLKKSDNDNGAQTMFAREQKVTNWVSSPAFRALAG